MFVAVKFSIFIGLMFKSLEFCDEYKSEKESESEVAQSRPTLCDPMDCSPPGSYVHGDSPGMNAGVGSHSLLQGIFPTQGLNPGLPLCRQTLYHLSHLENPVKENMF